MKAKVQNDVPSPSAPTPAPVVEPVNTGPAEPAPSVEPPATEATETGEPVPAPTVEPPATEATELQFPAEPTCAAEAPELPGQEDTLTATEPDEDPYMTPLGPWEKVLTGPDHPAARPIATPSRSLQLRPSQDAQVVRSPPESPTPEPQHPDAEHDEYTCDFEIES